MHFCNKVPAAAWRLLGKAEWPALKKANFALRLGRGAKLAGALCLFVFFSAAGLISSALRAPGPRCFSEQGEGAAELLGALGRCQELEDGSKGVDVFLKADSPQCFNRDGEGAAELLGALGRCRELEDVDFFLCEKIPESAWAALGEGVWAVLRNSEGIPETYLSRLRGQREG
ncbi:unnamed protein product [Symbiodinium necroappetens]|uniref:Uncharacterized protein n=1 Tax=Symbiodinium necroappetens TaxID=1628268 RepID=A0A812X7F3_9DINO|nr:unnamed protein product [Symbiodinium necroappetens]